MGGDEGGGRAGFAGLFARAEEGGVVAGGIGANGGIPRFERGGVSGEDGVGAGEREGGSSAGDYESRFGGNVRGRCWMCALRFRSWASFGRSMYM